MCPCEILDFKCQRFHQSCHLASQIKFNMPKNRSSSPISSSALMDAAPQKKHRRRRGGIPWMNNKFASIAFRGVCFLWLYVRALSRGFLIKFHKHIIYAFSDGAVQLHHHHPVCLITPTPARQKGVERLLFLSWSFFSSEVEAPEGGRLIVCWLLPHRNKPNTAPSFSCMHVCGADVSHNSWNFSLMMMACVMRNRIALNPQLWLDLPPACKMNRFACEME